MKADILVTSSALVIWYRAKIDGFMLFFCGAKKLSENILLVIYFKMHKFSAKKKPPRRDLTGHDRAYLFQVEFVIEFFLSQGPIIHS